MNNLKDTIQGNKKSFFLEVVNRDYLFQVVNNDEGLVLNNIICNRKIVRTIIITLGTIIVTTILGFTTQNEDLILTPIVGAFVFIPYFIFTTEEKIVFHNKSKKYRAYNVLGVSFEVVRFDKIYGIKTSINKNKKSTKIEIEFVEKRKTLFGTRVSAIESMPKLYRMIEGEFPSQIELDKEIEKILELARGIRKISDDKLLILDSKEMNK